MGCQTVGEWLADQGLETYLAMNDALMELIALKNQLRPGPLSVEHAQWAGMALYDIEALREHALAGELPRMNLDLPLPSSEDEDEAWLRWGLRWINRVLFGEHRCI